MASRTKFAHTFLLHLLLLVVVIIAQMAIAESYVLSNAREPNEILELPQLAQDEWPIKRSEPWMTLFTSDFLREAEEHSPAQSYRGLRGKRSI
ncbi:unnamed protein product [Toxocara canis]|nr:unnamed protein product [Toxocara canis]